MPDMAEPPEFLRILRSRIRERMAEERLSARDVSLQAKLGSSAVSDILLAVSYTHLTLPTILRV